MQTVYLEGAMWNRVRKVLFMILFLHQVPYWLQVSHELQLSNLCSCQGLGCPIFAIVRDHKTPFFF